MISTQHRLKLRSTPVPAPVRIAIGMHQRESALLRWDPAKRSGCPHGHRGWWAYDRKVYGDLAVGQRVDFVCCGEIVARGVVTGVAPADGELIKQLYQVSGVNGTVFTWKDVG